MVGYYWACPAVVGEDLGWPMGYLEVVVGLLDVCSVDKVDIEADELDELWLEVVADWVTGDAGLELDRLALIVDVEAGGLDELWFEVVVDWVTGDAGLEVDRLALTVDVVETGSVLERLAVAVDVCVTGEDLELDWLLELLREIELDWLADELLEWLVDELLERLVDELLEWLVEEDEEPELVRVVGTVAVDVVALLFETVVETPVVLLTEELRVELELDDWLLLRDKELALLVEVDNGVVAETGAVLVILEELENTLVETFELEELDETTGVLTVIDDFELETLGMLYVGGPGRVDELADTIELDRLEVVADAVELDDEREVVTGSRGVDALAIVDEVTVNELDKDVEDDVTEDRLGLLDAAEL
ncbi:hypothetical protein LTR78_010678 [Recurvomyces mirabilis]|uniref:Uncharacterized protein n=1 Tax=Recurvomyces mirabilis TaxID=574656 RepID=A0AAE0WI55_9PEZI|nr:hypothetical protein LTR78_010678 [Recurvomyces mirabilis]KAK5149526.1 hypothetical protein LTS14_010852 [Recurvomyces mirabilis]